MLKSENRKLKIWGKTFIVRCVFFCVKNDFSFHLASSWERT